MGSTTNPTVMSAAGRVAEPPGPARAAAVVQDSHGGGTERDTADVRLAATGDLIAFERLYRRHAARIHTLARRMLGAADADEATQDAFVLAWEKLATFRAEAAFSTWLHRLAINLFLRRRARETRLRERFLEDDGATATNTARPTAHPGVRIDLERAIDQLPEGARQVFTLFDIEGYRHEEIAELLGITVGTSKSQLHRARMLLRAQLT